MSSNPFKDTTKMLKRVFKGKSDGKSGSHKTSQAESHAAFLKKDVLETDLIDERTREELMQNFLEGGELNKRVQVEQGETGLGRATSADKTFEEVDRITALFNEAKEGTSAKFKARMKTQQMFNTLVDTPDASRLRGGNLAIGSKVRK